MPTRVPDLTRKTSFASAAAWFSRNPTATKSGSVARLDASMMALSAGSVASTVSWGFDAGAAPAGVSRIVASVTVRTFENMAVFGALGFAGAFAKLSMTIDEVSPTGSLVRRLTNVPTTIFDSGWPAYAGYIIGASNIRASVIGIPVITRNRYLVFVNLQQAAAAGGIGPSAVSNCTVDFGPIFFTFTN